MVLKLTPRVVGPVFPEDRTHWCYMNTKFGVDIHINNTPLSVILTLYAGVNSTLMLVLIFYLTPLGVDLLLSDTMGVDLILLV